MPVSATTLAALMEAGVQGSDLVKIVRLIDADMAGTVDSTAEKRRAYDRERKAEKRNSGGKSGGQNGAESGGKSGGIPPEKPAPHARKDNLLTTEVTGLAVVVISDWPNSDAANELAKAVNSPRLDPQKSTGLVTTAGRLSQWRAAGAGWADVVIPVVRALAHKTGDPIKTWSYFDAAIGQALDAAKQSLPSPEPRHERPDTPSAKRLAREDNLSRGFNAADAVVEWRGAVAASG